MFVFVVLFAFLQTLRGAPLLPPDVGNSFAIADVSGITAPECPVAPDDGTQQLRTVYTIIKSCLLTIFACVWTSGHPNINGPRDSRWACLKRKVVTMLYAVIAPEMVLFWALRQRSAAKEIAKKYNKKLVTTGETKTSLWRRVVDWFLSLRGKVVRKFQPLPKETTWRGDGQLWTITHGFFIQMGGFILYDGGYPKEVLDYRRLEELLEKQAIDVPTVTERDLQDRSKGDTISKGIVVLQTTWFVLQCVARADQRLPLSELEVLTLAFAVVNVTIYAAWWDKPQGVDMAICVPLKRAEKDIDESSTPLMEQQQHELMNVSHPELAKLPCPEHRHSNDSLSLTPSHEQQHDESTSEKHSWLRRTLRKDREQHSFPFFLLLRISFHIVVSVLRPLNKLGEPVRFEKKDLRVPMFYASSRNNKSSLWTCVVGTIFGAIHLLAWVSEFPSLRELVLWRVSAIVLTVAPFLIFFVVIAKEVGMRRIAGYIGNLFALVAPFYVAARFIVIIVALLAICHPPRDVLRDVSWTTHLPHF